MAPSALVIIDADNPLGRVVDPNQPAIYIDDAGLTRGDGVFETMLVHQGSPRKLDAHLERLEGSAANLGLRVPAAEQWEAGISTAVAELGELDAVVKLMVTRGRESTGQPSWLILASHTSATPTHPEIAVVLLDRGYDSDLADRAPWLLLGAKTLSYAVNMAALRYAKANGADDAVFYSSDGKLLEGPTSSLLLAQRDGAAKRLITPEIDFGILPGTTQGALFALAKERGWELGYGPLEPQDLLDADAAWLVSSIRGVATISAVDGNAISTDADLTAEIRDFFTAID